MASYLSTCGPNSLGYGRFAGGLSSAVSFTAATTGSAGGRPRCAASLAAPRSCMGGWFLTGLLLCASTRRWGNSKDLDFKPEALIPFWTGDDTYLFLAA